MRRQRTGFGYVASLLLIAAGCSSADANLEDHVPGSPAPDALPSLQPSAAGGSATIEATAPQPVAAYGPAGVSAAGPSVRPPLPGRSARTVLDEELNEAENLFFTEDGRLFVSGAEDIFEIKRAADGSFTKTDYFHEDCLVEGIVRSGRFLYGVCTLNNEPDSPAFLIAGELTAQPEFHRIASLTANSIPNGMTVDPEGRIYITESLTNQIVRVTLASPLEVERMEVWAEEILLVNGIKYVDHAIYVTMLDVTLVSFLLRIPILPDGNAGRPERLYSRALTVLDDILPFDDGFIITDFVNGTLIFWNERRGAYAETPPWTFYGPTSLVQGRPPMFDEQELIVAEKGLYQVRDEIAGDLLSMYQLP